jgi:hypothetical protein
MIPTPVKIRRQFDETFKREALYNWLSSGKSAGVIGRELGPAPPLISRPSWMPP